MASQWAGNGSLWEWLAPGDWEITRKWSTELVQARAAYVILLQVAASVLPRLPRHAGEWMDLLEQEIHRVPEYADVPSVHTDWAATLSTFGRYPSPLYIERLPRGTFDTPLTRTLKWVCNAVARAEEAVNKSLHQRPLTSLDRVRLFSAMELSEVRGASDSTIVDDTDVAVCASLGGVWSLVARCARQLAVLWRGKSQAQLDLLSHAPILPDELRGVLFEVGTLGSAAAVTREVLSHAVWLSGAPLAAAQAGTPCLMVENGDTTCNFYYQTVPQVFRLREGPYRTLTRSLGGAPLRPDIWLLADLPAGQIELVIECKYSAEPRYISTGVAESLTYGREYPARQGALRIHMVVGPQEIVPEPKSWGDELAVGTPADLRHLVAQILDGKGKALLAQWA